MTTKELYNDKRKYFENKKIQQCLYNAAKIEYYNALRLLLKNVRVALKTNPHNTFKGTPKEYIRKFHLHNVIKRSIYQHYEITY